MAGTAAVQGMQQSGECSRAWNAAVQGMQQCRKCSGAGNAAVQGMQSTQGCFHPWNRQGWAGVARGMLSALRFVLRVPGDTGDKKGTLPVSPGVSLS